MFPIISCEHFFPDPQKIVNYSETLEYFPAEANQYPGVRSDTLYNKQELSKKNFVNKGFAIVYSQDLYNEKKISKKMDSREMVVFQKNLKKGTIVRIKNILNDKTIIAKVGSKSEYPLFNNVVITERISNEIDLDLNEPYVEVYEVLQNSTFIAKKAKTYAKEKEVADKAPVDTVNINDLNSTNKKNLK